jgi:predicted ATPase/class 3 adenylate cyclase
MRDLPSGTVTFLFTDIEGSTKLLHDLGAEQYAAALEVHRRVVREAFHVHGGVEVDTQGDAFFVAFARASDAVATAAKAQAKLVDAPERVRIGVHTGEPIRIDEGYVGLDTHKAARICAAGHGGQVLLSQTTRDLLEEGFELRDLGEHRLKDLAEPLRLYQLGPGEFPPLRTLYRTNLPLQATPFLGRERELAEVLQLLSSSHLLTLTGPGGIGKTRLALQAAAEVAEEFPDGVWWTPLEEVRDAAHVLELASAAIGVDEDVIAYIGNKSLLLLFDGFEHLIDAGPTLGELLAACPDVTVLVTSREALQLRGEQVYPVPPLLEEEAMGFFAARARTWRPDFGTDETIAAICRRLDNLPLALELAAARVKVLSPRQILDRLERRLPLLLDGARDAPARQRTLRATIEWSHGLLSSDEQGLFRRLSVFVGGCTIEAAEGVGEAELETLASLVDKSLLRFGEERYSMLETIREYAFERLLESGEADMIRRRHAEHLLRLGEAVAEEPGDKRQASLVRLRPELDNLRAAVAWALVTDAELALRLGWVAVNFQPQPSEWRRWLDEAVAHGTDGNPLARARGLQAAAYVASSLFDEHEQARSLYEQSLQAYRDLGHDGGVARVLAGLAVIAAQADPDRARELFEESLAIYRMLGDQDGEWIVLHNLGELERRQGEYKRAAELLEESVVVARQHGDLESVAMSIQGLGDVALDLGHWEVAQQRYRESLAMTRTLVAGGRTSCYCLAGMAAAAAMKLDAPRAGLFWGALQALEDELGIRLPPGERSPYERKLAGLDEEDFAIGVLEGQTRQLDGVLEQAIVE